MPSLRLALFTIVLCAPAIADTSAAPPLLAVLELKNKVHPPLHDEVDAQYFTDHVREVALSSLHGGLRIISRENVVELLRARGKTLEQCEGECEVETGRSLGADLVVSGEIVQVGKSLKASLRLHDTRSGDLLAAQTAAGKTPEELDTDLSRAVALLMEPLRNRPTSSPEVSAPNTELQPPPASAPAELPKAIATSAATRSPAVDAAALDRSVEPCSDFYGFACGGWLAHTTIPADQTSWSRSFSEISKRNLELLRNIAERDARGEADPADPFAVQVGDLYADCMDEVKAESASMPRLHKLLGELAAVNDAKSLAKALAWLSLAGPNPLFAIGDQVDAENSTSVIAAIDQDGLTLPSRDWYLGEAGKKWLPLFREHIAALFVLAGDARAEAEKEADSVVGVETQLAESFLDAAARRDPAGLNHPTDLAGLRGLAPKIDWTSYFAALKIAPPARFNIMVPAALSKANELASQPATLRSYLRWQFLSPSSWFLSQAFVAERERFRKLLEYGELAPRWKRCVRLVDAEMGDAIGRSFLAQSLGANGSERAQALARRVVEAMGSALTRAEWLDAAAREVALKKLRAIRFKIGAAERFADYTGLKIGRTSLLDAVLAARELHAHQVFARIGKPADRSRWAMSPATVNGYLDPQQNELVFPAGILQPPFFRPDASDAANLGAFGTIVAHELTHGFDDEGHLYDAQGKQRDWWTAHTQQQFSQRAECVKSQYAAYDQLSSDMPGLVPAEALPVNATLTLGENLADVSAIKLAHNALQAIPAAAEEDGFPSEQQFFLSYAQQWCRAATPADLRQRNQTDPHAPAKWRVNGPLADSPEFAAAFRCASGSAMAPANRCAVW